jgi:hypothetical protein
VQFCGSDPDLKAFFEGIGTTFPDDVYELGTWLSDLEDEQLSKIKERIMKMKEQAFV